MFKNVLVGVDGSPNARDAIALASRLMGTGGKLTFAHVRRGEVFEEREDARKLLEEERTVAEVEAELVGVVSTRPGRGLHVQAETQGADLLVVGSCHRGAFGRLMLGDETRAALNGAPCAIAIAAVGYAECPTPFSRIGVAYNGSPESKTALAAARALAAPSRATLKAMEVVSLTVYSYAGVFPPAIGESIDTYLEEGNKRLEELPGVEGRAVYGITGEELAAFGDQVDLLVVGSRSYGPIRRMAMGSTSEYLERHARCSLLILPRGASVGELHHDAPERATV